MRTHSVKASSVVSADAFTPIFGSGRGGRDDESREERSPKPDLRPVNTRLSYVYRDADNYKNAGSAILVGRYENNDIEVIRAALDSEMFFIPSQVDLLDLQEGLAQFDVNTELDEEGVNFADHAWHELDLATAISRTDEEATTSLSWAELISNFRDVVGDETAVDLAF